jgi:hypothetical protein
MWTLGRRRTRDRSDSDRVKAFVFEALGRDPAIAISVSEIACADPACPGDETVILVMAPGRKTAAAKVGKALALVTEDDVRDALKDLSYTP